MIVPSVRLINSYIFKSFFNWVDPINYKNIPKQERLSSLIIQLSKDEVTTYQNLN